MSSPSRGDVDMSHTPSTSDRVTALIVTSPVKSHPSTEMLDQVLFSIEQVLPNARKIVCCDGYEVDAKEGLDDKRCHGRISPEMADKYRGHITELKSRGPAYCEVVELQQWGGFSQALKAGLDIVDTPLVMVMPHDVRLDCSTTSGDTDNASKLCMDAVKDVCDLIENDVGNGINYVGFLNGRTAIMQRRYREKGLVLDECKVEVPTTDTVVCNDRTPRFRSVFPLPIWKENPHIASLDAYKKIVFSEETSLRTPKRGQFIEETLGQAMLKVLKKHATGEHLTFPLAYHKEHFGTWMLTGEELEGVLGTVHLDGKSYMDMDERVKRGWRVNNGICDVAFVEQCREWVRRVCR